MIRIIEAKPLDDYQLRVRFNDGLEGVHVVDPARRGGIFAHLLARDVFNAVTVNQDFGCVEWPGGIDLCPTAMHREMLAQQRAILAKT